MYPKASFRFTQLSRLPYVGSLSSKGRWACSTTPDNWTHYCVHVRVTLGEGRGDQPALSHVWSGLQITDMLQESCPGDWITETVVLTPGKQFFFGRCLHREGSPYRVQMVLNSAWGVQIIGQENCTGGSDFKHCARRLLSYCRCHHGQEN